MATGPALTQDQNILPVQAYFNLDGSFNTFIGQGVPFVVSATESIGIIDTTVSGTFYPTFSAINSGQVTSLSVSSTKLSFNPSTGVLTANGGFVGSLNGTASTATNLGGGGANTLVYQSSAGNTAYLTNGTTGQVLVANTSGAPTWSSVSSSVAISDQTTSPSIFYPLFVNATSGSTTTVDTSSTKLQYVPSTGILTATGFSGSGTSLTSIPNGALVNSSVTIGSTAVALGATVTTFDGLTSVTSTTFVGALTGNASSATTATTATNATNSAITDNTSSSATWYPTLSANSSGNNPLNTSSTKLSFVPSTGTLSASIFNGNLGGGSANQIVYQTGANATSFITAPSVSSTYLQWTGSAFTWATVSGSPGGSNTQVQYNSSGSFAGSANMTFNGTTFTLANDASISGLTVGKGGGAVSSNTAVGNGVMTASATGLFNVGIGLNALNRITSSNYNTGVGSGALLYTTTGSSNTAIGSNSLYQNISGGANIAIGSDALNLNTVGNYNVAVGVGSLNANTASSNTAIGYQAAYSNATGSSVTTVGYRALYANTGNGNNAFGSQALTANTAGIYNNAFGASDFVVGSALGSNTTGSQNNAFGNGALASNVSGNYNSAFGHQALVNNTGSNNTAVGYQAAATGTVGIYNVAIGSQALYSIGNLSGLTAVGYQSQYSNNGASNNTSLGYLSLYSNTSGASNTAIGNQALYSNTASSNTAVGYQSLYNSTSTSNTALGYKAGNNITTAPYNVAVGNLTLQALTTGTGYATAVGNQAGYNYNPTTAEAYGSVFLGQSSGQGVTLGHDNTFIGGNSGVSVTSGSNNVILGAYGGGTAPISATGSNYIVLSDGAGNVRQTIDSNGNVGIGTTSPTANYRLDAVANVNAQAGIRVANTNAGAATLAQTLYSNGIATSQVGVAGTGFTTYGVITANSGYMYVGGGNTLALAADGTTGTITFGTGGGATEKMRLLASGALSFGASGTAYGTSGQALISGGSSASPAWGTLGVTGGGTGLSSLTTGYIPYGNGTSALSSTGNLQYGSGFLGIGSVPSAWGVSNFGVQTNGGSLAGISGGTQFVLFANSYYDGSNYIYQNTAPASNINQYNGEFYFFTAPSGTAGNTATFTQRLIVKNSGAIGLGASGDTGTSGQVLTSAGSSAVPTWSSNISGNAANVTGIVAGANGGTGVANTGSTITVGGNLTFTGAYTTAFTVSANTAVTLPTSGTLLTTAGSGSSLTFGTGTLSLAGNLTTSGAFTTTLTTTANTSVTLPTSGTLLTTAGSGSSLTFGTGSLALGGNLTTSGAFTTTLTATANTSVTLPTSGTLLTTAGSGSSLTFGTGTLSLAGNVTHSGAFTQTFTATGNTSVTLPTSGTLSTLAGTETLTNKWIQPRVLASTANSATPTLNTDNYDMMVITGQSVAITNFSTNLTGTPVNGQKLWIAITGTGAIAITWGTSFESSTVTLPSTTVTTARLDVGFVWNVATSKWRCVAVA